MKKDFSVALCDTQKNDITNTESMIREWLAASGHSAASLELFGDYHTLKERILSGFSADIYVLGISSHSSNGIELGRLIREQNADAPIIYVTGSKSHALEAYELHALRYLVKPVERSELVSALDFAYLVRSVVPVGKMQIRMSGEMRSVNSDSVVYIENNVRSMRYVLRDGSTLTGTRRNISFEEFFAPYLESGSFVQTHKSFIVNIKYIRSLKATSLVLTNGAQVPISRRHSAEVSEACARMKG